MNSPLHFWAAGLLVVLFLSKVSAQSTTSGFDPLFAQQLQTKLNQLGAGGSFAGGLTAAVSVPGQGIWAGTWGRAAVNTPVTPNMRFGMASNSKAIVAGLILKLQDEGLLHVDDPIGDYLPPHPQINPQITIRQLLEHTSGLFDFINQWSSATEAAYSANPNHIWTYEELLATVGNPVSAPDAGYSYSNTNYLLLGRIAETAAGQSIHQLLHSRIFNPLGLQMAYPPLDNVFAAPYSNLWNTAGSGVTLSPGGSQGFLTFTSTAGSVWSTAFDMVRWYDALFGNTWLSAESRRDLTDNDGYMAYAIGIRLRNVYGRSVYYHVGIWGYRSYMLHDPSTGISLCIIANQYGASVTNQGLDLFAEVLNRLPAPTHNVAIRSMAPNRTSCTAQNPIVTIRNEGTATLHHLQIALGLDGEWQDTLAVNIGDGLPAGEQRLIPLAFDLGAAEGQKRQWQARAILDTPDAMPANNDRSAYYRFENNEMARTDFYEDFESGGAFPGSLVSLQTGNILDWRVTRFAGHQTPGHSLARINYYDGNEGDKYAFELPLIQVNAGAELSFSYAHAFYPGSGQEVLRGYISTNCGSSYLPLFELSGNNLATAAAATPVFLPTAAQWRRHTVELSPYAGENVLIRLELENQYGNMSYLDDIRVEQQATAATEPVREFVAVWPSPATDHLVLVGSQDFHIATVTLTDGVGRPLLHSRHGGAAAPVRIERGSLPSGCYFLEILSETGRREMRKVVFR